MKWIGAGAVWGRRLIFCGTSLYLPSCRDTECLHCPCFAGNRGDFTDFRVFGRDYRNSKIVYDLHELFFVLLVDGNKTSLGGVGLFGKKHDDKRKEQKR